MRVGIVFTLIFFSAAGGYVGAQDIESLVKARPVKVNGGINVTSGFNNTNGIDRGMEPFFWTINANLNLKFFGEVDAPFRLKFSPQVEAFNYPYQTQQPFNQFGISPKYKWCTMHLGYRSMQISKYLMSGNRFYGIGTELRPKGRWSYSMLYGRLSKASDQINENDIAGTVLFNRKVFANRLRFKNKRSELRLAFLKAWDVDNSVLIQELTSNINPEENFVVGFYSKSQLGKRIRLEVDYNNSLYTSNKKSNPYNRSGAVSEFFGVSRKLSSESSKAIESRLVYTANTYNLSLSYRWIDPNYRSMGIPFVNNDLEDLTANLSWKMMKSKINVGLSGGLQHNNLDRYKESRMTRTIGSINIQYQINRKLSFRTNYSNYTTTTEMIRIIDLDSLNYYQVTSQLSGGLNFVAKKKNKSHSATLVASYQEADDINNLGSQLFNSSVGYSFKSDAQKLVLAGAYNIQVNTFIGVEKLGLGPTLNLSRSIFKSKIVGVIGYSYLGYRSQGIVQTKITNFRSSIQCKLKKNQNVSFSGFRISKTDNTTGENFRELRGMLNYSYRF